jgi:hypothetical protein
MWSAGIAVAATAAVAGVGGGVQHDQHCSSVRCQDCSRTGPRTAVRRERGPEPRVATMGARQSRPGRSEVANRDRRTTSMVLNCGNRKAVEQLRHAPD